MYPIGAPKLGHHGYDADHVDEMNAIMLAFGPDFRVGYEAEPIRQVDHYSKLLAACAAIHSPLSTAVF